MVVRSVMVKTLVRQHLIIFKNINFIKWVFYMKLEYNEKTKRYNDLHSGEIVSIFINEKWKKVC